MRRRTPPPDAALAAAIDAIVARFDWPRDDGPSEVAPVSARLRREAAHRAAALRAAADAIETTHAEAWTASDAYIRTPNGSATATIGARVRWHRPDTDPAALVALRDTLASMAADLDALAAPPRRARGRPSDRWLAWLVDEVAIACRDHGLVWTDYPDGPAARLLGDVLSRVRWAPRLSAAGLRPHLRAGAATQRSGRTSRLAGPRHSHC